VSNPMGSLLRRSTGGGVVVAVAALADLLGARRLAWERASSAPLFADQECGANGRPRSSR
jgi:hypothetical protein